MKKRGRPKGSKNKKSYLTRIAHTRQGGARLNSASGYGNARVVDTMNISDASHTQTEFPSLDGDSAQSFPDAPSTAIAGNENDAQGSAVKAAPPSGWSSEECAGLTQLAGLVAANLTSFQGFAYSDDESRLIGEPLSKVLNKYFPDGAGKTDELSLIVVLLATTTPKINAYIQERRKNTESAENKNG